MILHAVTDESSFCGVSSGTASAGQWDEEMVTLDYHTAQVIQELHTTGLYQNAPVWCRITELIFEGVPLSHGSVLERAMQLCEAETGSCRWPDIPESFLERALTELCSSPRCP